MQHDNMNLERGETMAEDKNSRVIQNQDRINKLIDGLTLFDDDLMSRVFDKNIEATELLLRIILERKIKVISVNGQEEMKSAAVGVCLMKVLHKMSDFIITLIVAVYINYM